MIQAEYILQKCGGHAKVAEWLNLHTSVVLRWTYPKSRGGTGGLIPSRHHAPLLKKANENDVGLVPSDFFPSEQIQNQAAQ